MPTFPSFAKLRWLFRSPTFQKSPVRVLSRIVRWEYNRIFEKRSVVDFDDTLNIWLYPNDGVARLTYYFGYHEPEVFDFLHSYLREDMVFLDIGANIGTVTLFAAKRVGVGGKVYAFEPQCQTYQRLVTNLQLNGFRNVVAEPFAIGESQKNVVMRATSDTAKSYVRYTTDFSSHERQSGFDQCQMISLDDYFSRNALRRIDYMKVDVEGWEYNVLLGGQKLIRRYAPPIIQLELYDEFLARSGSSKSEVRRLLSELSYRLFELSKGCPKLVPVPACQDPSGNVFAVHSRWIDGLKDFFV